jgi:signal transduction histidine kinase
MAVPELSKQEIIDLVARFSHDVASPLTGVLALTEVLIQEHQTTDRTRDDLRRIHSAAEEIASMVLTLTQRVAPRQIHRHSGGS